MNTDHSVPDLTAVVTIYDNRRLISETNDTCSHGYESGATGSGETKMLVEIMIVQAGNGWFEDVCCSDCSARDPPSIALVQERGLCLGAGETELANERCAEPCS